MAVDNLCHSCLVIQVIEIFRQIQSEHKLQWIRFVAVFIYPYFYYITLSDIRLFSCAILP